MKEIVKDKEWNGMPEFINEKNTPYKKIIMTFKDQEGVDEFAKLIGQNITDRSKTMYYPAPPKKTTMQFWVDEDYEE
jgi:hypothetical protein